MGLIDIHKKKLKRIAGLRRAAPTRYDARAAQGALTMLDVSAKSPTLRTAVARGRVTMRPETLRLIRDNALPKRDVLPTARAAGCLAAKRTPDLIPDCHPVALTHAEVTFVLHEDPAGVEVTATARTYDRTGVEMEALTAAAVACLTVYDMAKCVDPGMVLGGIALVSKTGGKSDYAAAGP